MNRLLRSIDRSGRIGGSLSTSAVRQIVQRYGGALKANGNGTNTTTLNPHDLRRTHAQLARLGGAPLETIQKTLGHSSVKTTETYVNTGLDANAGDFFTL